MAIVFRHAPCVSAGEMRRNVRHTKTLGLPSVEYAGNVAVVGGGPSLIHHIDELKAWAGPIWAINGTWAWLKDRGVKATFFTIDPKPQPLKFGPGDSALVASVGCAELFNSLAGGYVRTFDLGFHDTHTGVTSATAAPHLAIRMGHRSVTFFGCDSSFGDDGSHVYDDDLPFGMIDVHVGGELFETKPEFVMQADDLAALCRELPGFHRNRSGGLLAALIAHPECDVADQYLFEAA